MANTDKNDQSEEMRPALREDGTDFFAEALSSMSRENLRALLFLAAGRQDSSYRLFRKPVFVSADDILDLNSRVQAKLAHHESAGIVSVDLMYTKDQAIQFGTFAEFESHNWSNSNTVKSLTVRWDFWFKMPRYRVPQRHLLTVKLLAGFDPLHFLQALTSEDPADLTEMELQSAPIVARVDFISHLLSDELLNIVEEWVKSRRQAVFRKGWRSWLKSRRHGLARVAHYSVPTVVTLLAAAILHWYSGHLSPNAPVTFGILTIVAYWLLLSGVSIQLATKVGRVLGGGIFNALHDYGQHSIFQITGGDENRQTEIAQSNEKEMRTFFLSSLWALLINIAAAGISIFLYNY